MAATIDPRPPIGWPLLPLPDEHGRLAWPSLEQSVRDSIEVILRTRAREQLMRPRFGAGLVDFLHEPNTPATRARIRDLVSDAIRRHEPRALLGAVVVTEEPGAPSRVRIEIGYRVRPSGAIGRVGVSLVLGG